MQSLKAAHTHYTSLLHRVGRCLAFGCGPAQLQEAVALVPAISRCWPDTYLKKDCYAPLYPATTRRWGADLANAAKGLAVSTSRRMLSYVYGEESQLQLRRANLTLEPIVEVPKVQYKHVPLTCYVRLGDAAQTMNTLLPPRGESVWTTGRWTRFTMEAAVLGPAMTPLAMVTNVVSVRCTALKRTRNRRDHHDMLSFQESNVKMATEELRELEARVRALEEATWDREDAVEDTGGR